MNTAMPSSTRSQPVSLALRALLLTPLAGLAALAGGCHSPVKGPTDPKEFMTQRREWTTRDAATAQAVPTDLATPTAPMPSTTSALSPPTRPSEDSGTVQAPK
jgi:hypothetical protein